MKNPLRKRFLRELKHDFGKYIAIFLFITLTIGFVSGFLVAGNSMKTAYTESFEKYNIENGHFLLSDKADNTLISEIENKDVKLYENYYADLQNEENHTYRLFKIRDEVNLQCVMEGRLPKSNDEIAIDRLYAKNNDIKIGDTVTVEGKSYTISGMIALSDYSALFKKNTDMMFDANKFTVALVTQEAFSQLNQSKINYCYSWKYNDNGLNDNEKNSRGNNLMETVYKNALISGNELNDFVMDIDNKSIQFTGNDLGDDKVMMQTMLYIVIAILAFVFAVTTANTIEHEAKSIGTLRASGYTKGELLKHYAALPIIVTGISAIVGNILGYTVFKYAVVGMYYGSYSLPTYKTIWNGEAFLLTTVIPIIIMLAINLLVIARMLRLSPLDFLRCDLHKKKKKKAIKLKRGSFISRFRKRVIFQNKNNYITMFVGILFANILLIFGISLNPILQNYKTEILDNTICDYQYILKTPVSTTNKSAEKYCLTCLTNNKDDEISVYGIENGSRYIDDFDLTGNKIFVSNGYMEKYNLKAGDTLTLKEEYSDKSYDFIVSDSYKYPAAFTIFVNSNYYKDIFGKDMNYFTGYFSNEKLSDIDENSVVNIVTHEDLTVVTDQLDDSMGRTVSLFGVFSISLFVLIIYLLSKIIIEKNGMSISMIKILGYNNKETRKLYITSTTIMVIVSIILSFPLSYYSMKFLFMIMMAKMSGWMSYIIEPIIYVKMFLLGIVSYFLVSLIQYKKIKKISMQNALKNQE